MGRVDVMGELNMHFEQVPLEMVRERITRGEITEVEGDLQSDSSWTRAATLRYPQWQRPLQEALLELDPKVLGKRIAAAEVAVTGRLGSVLRATTDNFERHALQDALVTLRILKK